MFFDPPSTVHPQETSPVGDEPISPVPSRATVDFGIIAEPALVPANGIVTFHVYIQNNSEDAITGMLFTDQMETGLAYSPNASDLVSYDTRSAEIRYEIQKLEAGEGTRFSYSVVLASSRTDSLEGKIWLHEVTLNSADNSIRLQSHAAIAVVQGRIAWKTLGRGRITRERVMVVRALRTMEMPIWAEGVQE